MKKRQIVFVILAMLTLISCLPTSAYATTTLHFDYGTSNMLPVDGEIRTIAYSTGGGINRNIVIGTNMLKAETCNVFLVGSNGSTILWHGTILHNIPQQFYCGPDVYYVKIQSQNSANTGHAFCYPIG